LLSPGCTLDVSITAFLYAISSGFDEKLVIITISQSFPAMLLHNTVRLILSLFLITHKLWRCSQQSEYV